MAIAPSHTIFGVITDFLASNPTQQEIIAYQIPDEMQQRALDLLEKRKQDSLTFDEEMEMYDFIRADDMMSLLKSKTRLNLSKKS